MLRKYIELDSHTKKDIHWHFLSKLCYNTSFLIMLDQQLSPGKLLTGVPLLLLYMQLAFNLLNKRNLIKGTVSRERATESWWAAGWCPFPASLPVAVIQLTKPWKMLKGTVKKTINWILVSFWLVQGVPLLVLCLQLAFNLLKKCLRKKSDWVQLSCCHAVPLPSFSTCSWHSSFSIRRIFLKRSIPNIINWILKGVSLLQMLLNFKEKWKSYMKGQCHGKKMLHETLKKQPEKTTRNRQMIFGINNI